MGDLSQTTRGYLGGGGGAAPHIISTSSPNPNTIIIEWSQPVTLTSFGATDFAVAFLITGQNLGDGPVVATGASMMDMTHLQITTTDVDNGEQYRLQVSQGVVVNASSVVNFADTVFFTGNNVPLTVLSSRLVDATDLIITYSRAVQQSSASVPSNYSFVPTLVVNVVERISDTQYNIKTSRMQPNTFYTLTISNVRAFDGSLI